MTSDLPFSQVVEQIRQRDPKTWNRLLQRSKHRLTSYAYRNGLFSNDEIADLISETFVILIERLNEQKLTFEVEAQLDAYIMKTFINLIHNALRRKSKETKLYVAIEPLESDADDDHPSQPPTPDTIEALEAWYRGPSIADEQERIGQVNRALASLQPAEQELLMLWAQGYSYAAIAELLRLPVDPATLKVRLHRAKLRVAQWFANHTQKIASL
jgi:RNA polymerase sigma factor (sigma-70 family)